MQVQCRPPLASPFAALLACILLSFSGPLAQGLITVGPSGVDGVDCTACAPVVCRAGGAPDSVACAQQALRTALALLPPEGGEIVFLPGSYEFGERVTISAPNVHLRATGAVLVAPDGATTAPDLRGILDVEGDDFSLEGGTWLDAGVTDDGFLIRLQGDRARVSGCTFEVTGDAPGYAMLELPGPESACAATEPGCTAQRLGSVVTENEFLFNATNGPGLVGLRAVRGRGMRLLGNEFTSVVRSTCDCQGAELEALVQPAPVATAVLLVDDSHGVIANNVFSSLGVSSGVSGAALRVRSTPSMFNNEGHHLAVSGNFFEQCQEAMRFDGGKFLSISGNVVGRCPRALRLTSFDSEGGNPATQSGESNIVSGNQFHNCGSETSAAVLVEYQTAISVTGNQFTLANGTQVQLGANASQSFVSTNQFKLAPGLGCIPEAVRAEFGNFALIVRENVAFGSAGSDWERVVFPEDVDLPGRNTLENFLVGGCGSPQPSHLAVPRGFQARPQHP